MLVYQQLSSAESFCFCLIILNNSFFPSFSLSLSLSVLTLVTLLRQCLECLFLSGLCRAHYADIVTKRLILESHLSDGSLNTYM